LPNKLDKKISKKKYPTQNQIVKNEKKL